MPEETLPTGRGKRLQGRLWTADHDFPEQDCLGVVIIVHGLGDHSGRYAELARRLNAARWHVFAFDLIGHGRSPGRRGQTVRYEAMLSDIAQARATMLGRFPAGRQVLLGHSMGGNLALNYLLRQSEIDHAVDELDAQGLSALVLCAPILLPPSPPPRPHIFAAWITGHLMPWLRVDRAVDVDQLTQDPTLAAAIQSDQARHSLVSVYLATQLLSQGRWALDHARAVNVPTLIMYGQDDRLIDQAACQHVALRIGDQATLVNWPDLRHDLLHEIRRDEVTERLTNWLQELSD